MIVEKRLQFAEAYQHHGYRMSDVANTQTAGANNSVRGDTSFVIENDVVRFDDFAENEDGSCWAHICKSCAEKYGISEMLLDDGCGGGTCGVQGCENEADFYIDFPADQQGPAENERVWAVALDALNRQSVNGLTASRMAGQSTIQRAMKFLTLPDIRHWETVLPFRVRCVSSGEL